MKKNITLVIHPTRFQDFDILAIGDKQTLEAHKKANPHYHLIRKSRFGGIPILIIDTSDTLQEALTIIKDYEMPRL